MHDNDWPSYGARLVYHEVQQRLAVARQLPPGARVRYYLERTTGKYQTHKMADLLGVSTSTVQRVTRERVAAGRAYRSEGWVFNGANIEWVEGPYT